MGSTGKLISAVAILLVGGSLALVFRKTAQVEPPLTAPFEPLVRHELISPPGAAVETQFSTPLLATSQPAAPVDRPPTVPEPVVDVWNQPDHAPPRLAAEYPGMGADPDAARLAAVLPMDAVRESSPTEHTIVDGDTLDALAQRYLGDARRAGEIFEANRQVLADPALLPIGAKLQIPSR